MWGAQILKETFESTELRDPKYDFSMVPLNLSHFVKTIILAWKTNIFTERGKHGTILAKQNKTKQKSYNEPTVSPLKTHYL